MDSKLRAMFYMFFLLRFIAVTWEMASTDLSLKKLREGNTGFEPGSLMEKMARDTKTFFKNQINVHEIRLNDMFQELKILVSCLIITTIVLDTRARKKMTRISKRCLGILDPEMVLLVFFMSTVAFAEFCTGKLTLMNRTYSMHHVGYPSNIFVFFFVEIPCTVYLAAKLLSIFRWKFIPMLYMVFLLDDLVGIITDQGPGKQGLIRVSHKLFPERLQELLKSENLEKSIYKSEDPKDKRNAALVGFGTSKRIEIRGDFDLEGSEELHAIVLHEIGHSVDNTMVKRKIAKYAITLCEMAALTYIYTRGSKVFGCSDISTETFFIMFYLTYFILGRQWLFMLFNIYAQRSEVFADGFAKSNGYDAQLSRALFRITLEHGARIDPSFLYHTMNSQHPSTRSRID